MAGIEVLDQASGLISPVFKAGAQEWTNAFGPELLAMIYEVPGGLFLTNLGRLIGGLVLGIGALAGSAYVSGRDKGALMDLAAHWITHPNAPGLFGLMNASVATPQALAAELNALKSGVASNNFDLIRSAFTFTPADVDGYFRSVSAQFQSLFSGWALPGAPPSVASAAVVLSPESVVAQVQAAIGYGEVF